jgi:3-deoxy-D-manno-octulosonate 8-phosphate phosphatase (KDO 8-P phosphatase)
MARTLKLMAFDVDGVLTDGTLYYTATGDEFKAFNVRDGHGLKMLAQAGVLVAIITGRTSDAVRLRADNLGISLLAQGVEDKRDAMRVLLRQHGLGFEEAGYMGDDIVDLPLLAACGFSASVSDGHHEVRRRVDYVSRKSGGHGAVREVC